MTRFEREINGSLGDFWKRNAQEEVKKAVAQADEKATVEADGAIRWNSNGRYLMDDFCEKLEYAGYPFDREATARKRDAQNEEFLAEYRRNDKGLSGEALAEARAAFGEGTVVVDALRHKHFGNWRVSTAGSRFFRTTNLKEEKQDEEFY